MKIEMQPNGMLCISVQTESHGNSAHNQGVKDPNTEVYFGELHARVTFKDLNIEVTMNPIAGDWKDAKWARTTAWKAVCQRLTPDAFEKILKAARELGHQEGVDAAQLKIRKAIGVTTS